VNSNRLGWLWFVIVLARVADAAEPSKPVWTVTRAVGAPSHALYDSDSGTLFVTQISGEGVEKDGVGVVSQLDLNGSMRDCSWVSGLDAPKGIARHGKVLWVSDIDRLHEIDRGTGAVIQSLDVPGARFLTGVAVDSRGAVFIADMLASRIYEYRDGAFSVLASGDRLESPTGLCVDDDDRLVVAAWGLTNDYTTKVPGRFFRLDRQKLRPLSKPVGNLYGIVSDGSDGWIGTDFATGRVLHVTGIAEPRELLTLKKGVGGIEYVPSVKLLIVPEVTENRISAYDLSAVLRPQSR
jgi:hypothetical protein